MLRLGLVAVLALWANVASAATYYVATTGSNAVSCATAQTIGTPKQTLSGSTGALACLAAGDTLLVRAGTYAEAIEPGTGGTTLASGTSWTNTVRIAAYPNGCSPTAPNTCGTAGEAVWLKPTTSTPTGNILSMGVFASNQYVEWDGINFDASGGSAGAVGGEVGFGCNATTGANYIRIKNAEFIGNQGLYDSGAGGSSGGGDHLGIFKSLVHANCPGGHEFQNLKIHGGASNETGWTANNNPPNYGRYTAYAYYITASNVLIENNDISDTRYIGIQVAGSIAIPGAVIRNNKIHDVTRPGYQNAGSRATIGIILGDGADNTLVYNNLFYENGHAADGGQSIYCYTGSNAKIYQNTVYSDTGYGILTGASCSNATIQNNIAFNNAVNYLNNGSGTTTCASCNLFGTNPDFVNAAMGDFHLSTGSAAIDAGLTLGAVTSDYEGVSRPQGPGYDIGASEWTAGGGGAPCLPAGFSPANGATNVELFTTLSWTCGTPVATSYDVYYGIPGDVNSPLVSDPFTGTDGVDIGSNFSPYTGTGITNAQRIGNRVRSVNTSQYSVEALVAVNPQTDQWCRVQVVTLANSSNNIAGCVLRGTIPGASFSGYLVGVSGMNQTGSWIARSTNGLIDAYLAIGSGTVWTPGDRVQATMVGNTITLTKYPSTTPILTATDPNYTSGRPGLVVYSAVVGAVELDNYEAGTLGLPFIQNQTATSWPTPSQSPATNYQYQIVARNAAGSTLGPLVSYTTLGTTATPVGIRLRFAAP